MVWSNRNFSVSIILYPYVILLLLDLLKDFNTIDALQDSFAQTIERLERRDSSNLWVFLSEEILEPKAAFDCVQAKLFSGGI